MAKVIAICGKICSGKTFYANEIKTKENAVILSCDELMGILFNNDLVKKHDEIAQKLRRYLFKKSIDIIKTGASVILDWGFWSANDRKQVKRYFEEKNIYCEIHYLDEGLMKKLKSKWEEPNKNEIDVWCEVKR